MENGDFKQTSEVTLLTKGRALSDYSFPIPPLSLSADEANNFISL